MLVQGHQTSVQMSEAEYIARDQCPVCHRQIEGVVNKRRALQEHVKRLSKTCGRHRMWFETQYLFHFQHGGRRNEKVITAQDVMDSVRVCFGSDWSNRLSIVG